MISPEQLQQRATQAASPEVMPSKIDTYDGQGVGTRKLFAGAGALLALAGAGRLATNTSYEGKASNQEVAAQLAPTQVSEAVLPNEVMGGIGVGEIAFPINENTRAGISELAPGFAPEDLAFGKSIDMALHTPTRGATAFSQEGACSGEELQAFFLSNTPEAEAVKKHILDSETLTAEEKEAKLEGKGFLVMQVKKPAVLHGTTYYVDGEIRRANERAVPAGDLYLLSLKADGSIDQESSARCDCINPNIEKITPPTQNVTPPPVETTPPTSEVPPTTDTTVPEEETTTTTVPGSSTSSTSTSTSTTSTSTSTTSTTMPEVTTTTNPDKEDDEETPGPDDSPTPTTQPAPEGPATPDDGSENPVGGTSTTTTSTTPSTTTTTPTGGPTTTAPQTTQPTTPRG